MNLYREDDEADAVEFEHVPAAPGSSARSVARCPFDGAAMSLVSRSDDDGGFTEFNCEACGRAFRAPW
jgi:hypothetical protein